MHFIWLLPLASMVLADGIGLGCFEASTSDMNDALSSNFMSSKTCNDECRKQGKAIFVINSKSCWCGDSVPSSNLKASSGQCNIPCPGYPDETCGGMSDGDKFFNFFQTTNTDGSPVVNSYSTDKASASATALSSSTASPSKTSSAGPSDATSSSSHVSTTSTSGSPNSASSSSPTKTTSTSGPSSTSDSQSGKDDNSKEKDSGGISGGAIAGIVIGVIGGLALVGAAFFILRRRRMAYAYQNQASDRYGFTDDPFITAAEDKMNFSQNSTSAFVPVDQRLNPALINQRRLSEGSIADEQDYSRKILRVANPDSDRP